MLLSRHLRVTARRRHQDRSSLPVAAAACVLIVASLITALATWALVSLPGIMTAGPPPLNWHQQARRHRSDKPAADLHPAQPPVVLVRGWRRVR